MKPAKRHSDPRNSARSAGAKVDAKHVQSQRFRGTPNTALHCILTLCVLYARVS